MVIRKWVNNYSNQKKISLPVYEIVDITVEYNSAIPKDDSGKKKK